MRSADVDLLVEGFGSRVTIIADIGATMVNIIITKNSAGSTSTPLVPRSRGLFSVLTRVETPKYRRL